eukprot:gene22036-26712_t
MPIKAFNTSLYEQVPDEDVTPINYNLSRLVRRNEKTFRTVVAIIVGVLFVVAVSYTGYYFLEYRDLDDVVIYETAAGQDFLGGLNQVTLAQVRKTLPSLHSLSFGNADCGETSLQASCQASEQTTGSISVDSDTEYQEIVGFGGAFTEATAYHFFKLPPLLQRKFLDLYFGENGIKFSLGRIHINSCDFSLGSYNFDE